VIDNEIIGMALKMLRGIGVDEDRIAFDEIASVGPGGNFVAQEHTLEHMRTEFLEPMLVSREERAAADSPRDHAHADILESARQRAARIVEAAPPSTVPASIDESIRSRFGITLA